MDKNSREGQLYRSWRNLSSSFLQENGDAKGIFDSLKNGKNRYRRVDRIESSSFDESWIERIENALPDLGTIINNPRRNTKEVQNLVPVELVKKVNAETVQHLASHTAYIKSIAENGDVIPSKLRNIGSEDDLHTYENRFIATLIRRLVLFVEKRYEYVKTFGELKHHEILSFKNESRVNGKDVHIETKVSVITPKKDPESLQSNDYIERIKKRREYILYYYNSSFRRELKTEKNVRAPILQTNIIRKNPLYHKCFELYLFLSSYNRLGVDYSVKEDFALFDNDDFLRLNVLRLCNYLSLEGKDRPLNKKTNRTIYAPTIVTSLDDESFVFGPLHQGPISFVRTDREYLNYRAKKATAPLPVPTSDKEAAYYLDEYGNKEEAQKAYDSLVSLRKRKEKDQVIFDEVTKRNREAEKEKERKARKEFYRKRAREEQEYLDSFRKSIVEAAKEFRVEYTSAREGDIYPSHLSRMDYLTYLLHKGEAYKVEKVLASTYQDTKALLPEEEERSLKEILISSLREKEEEEASSLPEKQDASPEPEQPLPDPSLEPVPGEEKTASMKSSPFLPRKWMKNQNRKEFIIVLKDKRYYEKESAFCSEEENARIFSSYKEAKAIAKVYHGKVLGR